MNARLIRPAHLTLAIACWICLSAITPRLADAQVTSHQVAPAAPVRDQHQTFLISSVCIEFMCSGGDAREIIKASDPDPAEAERKAWELINQMCPGGVEYFVYLRPGSCRLIADTDSAPVEEVLYRQQVRNSMWVIKASLRYCDGSPGYKNVMIVGETRCQAIQNARQLLLCDLKDPCKAACMTYCIFKQPCQPAPAPACIYRPRY